MTGARPVPEDIDAVIRSNEEVAPDFHLLRLYAPRLAASVEPGQFVQLRVRPQSVPLLRVPLSVSGVDDTAGSIDVLFENMGPKTACLSHARSGETLRCMGPLGTAFPGPGNVAPVLVGGGIGVPPLLLLGSRLRAASRRVTLLVGARSAAKLLPDALLEPAADEWRVATDDGSAGHIGFVTELLAEELDAHPEAVVYTCGPHGMMAAAAALCRQRDVACYASLEEYMACGFGVCVGCVVPRAAVEEGQTEYANFSRVCIDGPVYDAKSIEWH